MKYFARYLPVEGEEVYGEQISDSLDGILSHEEVMEILNKQFDSAKND